jgi:hypothetical protein
VSSWQQYTLAFPEPDQAAHYFVIDPAAPKGRQITLSRSGHSLREFFRAARPGAVRIGATSDSWTFHPVAFRNVDRRLAVVVQTRKPGQITIRGLHAGAYAISCWTEQSRSDDPASQCTARQHTDADGAIVATLAAPGVLAVSEQTAEVRR